MACTRVCTLMVHTQSHCAEDLMLNGDIFYDYNIGDIVQVYDPDRINDRLILKVLSMPPTSGRLEISLSKVVAESLGFKPFGKVTVEKISEEQASISFVEFVFKRQYLQRGNMWRFKKAMFGKSVHMTQNLSINGMQAQILQLRNKSTSTMSGIITEKTKFVFRSRSSRVIWLVQISAEMWEFDQNGVLYFEKFLSDFVSPLLDSWKALGVSHMLTVIFFSRTLYLERISSTHHPDLFARKSLEQSTDGLQYQDSYRIVLENIEAIDKVAHIKKLRQEFWAYPRVVDWKVVAPLSSNESFMHSSSAVNTPAKTNISSQQSLDDNDSLRSSPESVSEVTDLSSLSAPDTHVTATPTATSARVNYAVPSDAVHGNFLEAINTSLNILDKHYMDRDLTRTGNAMVMISAGTGIFKVKPALCQITKQRMVDGGIGLDFISLSRPSVHVVPLFLVDCRNEAGGIKDFYETPYWVRVSYIDCKKEISQSLNSTATHQTHDKDGIYSEDSTWAQSFMPQPLTSLLTAQLVNSGDLKTLAKSYASTLPLALRELLTDVAQQNSGSYKLDSLSRESFRLMVEADSSTSSGSMVSREDSEIPVWGKVPPCQTLTKATLDWRQHNTKPMVSSNALSGLPILKRDRAESSSVAESLGSMLGTSDEDLMGEYQQRNAAALHQGHRVVSKDSLRASFDSDKQCDDLEFDRATRSRSTAIPNPVGQGGMGKNLSDDQLAAGTLSLSVASSSCDSQSPSQLNGTVHFDSLASARSSSGSLNRIGSSNSLSRLTTSTSSVVISEIVAEQQHLLAEISTIALKSDNREKLLELMRSHDQNVFKPVSGGGRDSLKEISEPTVVPPAVSTASDIITSAPQPASKPRSGSTVSVPDIVIPTLELPKHVVAFESLTADTTSKTPLPSTGSKLSPRSAALVARSSQGMDRRRMMMSGGGAGRGGPGGGGIAMTTSASTPRGDLSLTMPPSAIRQSSDSLLKDSAARRFKLSSRNFVSKSQFVTSALQTPHSRSNFGESERNLSDKNKQTNGGGNQEFMIQHGKIIPIPAAMKNRQGEDRAQLIREYCDVTCINPFRPKEGQNYLQSITHNRRRWSHVFPSGAFERFLGHLDYGLNWKSLTQPAILPLSTDYMPNVNALAKGYDVLNSYQLLLDRYECPFLTPELLLQEMISQRLSREFQLIEGVDIEPFVKFIKHSMSGNNSRNGASSVLRRERGVLTPAAANSVTPVAEGPVPQTFFILSMGHRIQFLDYDAATDQVNVTQYRSKRGQNNEDESNAYTYHYELWVPQTNRFQTVTQTFYQFPVPELKWNTIDNVIVGNLPFDPADHGTKARRLRYTILPDAIASDAQIDEYYAKIEQLFEFLGKYCSNNDVIRIDKDRAVLRQGEVEALVDSWMAAAYGGDSSVSTAVSAVSAMSRGNSGPAGFGRAGAAAFAGGAGGPSSRNKGSLSAPGSMKSTNIAAGAITAPVVSRGNSSEMMHVPVSGASAKAESFQSAATDHLLQGIAMVIDQSDSRTLATPPLSTTPSISSSTHASPATVPMVSPSTLMSPPAHHTPLTSKPSHSRNVSINSSISLYQRASTSCETLKLHMKGVAKDNPNWLFLKFDRHIYTYKSYHVEFHWLVCDSWLIDEFITLLFRRCSKWGLRLCQTPEYFSTPNLNVHPFRAQPYIKVPSVANVPDVHSSPTRLVERLYFRRSVGWVFDNEQQTDWNGLGLPVPNYAERDRDILAEAVQLQTDKPPLSGTIASPSARVLPVVSSLSKSIQRVIYGVASEEGVAHSAQSPLKTPHSTSSHELPTRTWGSKSRASVKDRQYIHHMGLATVRVAAQGFVWLQNASARVSDVNLNVEEKKDLTMKKMRDLDRLSQSVAVCYEMLLDVISVALSLVKEETPPETLEIDESVASAVVQ